MTELVDKLLVYASGKMSDADEQELEALLTRYVDGDLEPTLAAEIERAIDRDDALAMIIADARKGRQWIQQTFAPGLREALIRPASPDVQRFVDDLVTNEALDEGDQAEILPLHQEPNVLYRRGYALAALVAVLLLVSGWSLHSSIQSQLDDAHNAQAQLREEVEQLTIDQKTKTREVAALEQLLEKQRLNARWTIKVAEYHSLYARQSERHLVEVSADQQDHIEKWLGKQLGRSLIIPDLSKADMMFKGARLLAIAGKPVAQLMYLDSDGKPLGFCFMRNLSGEVKAPELNRHEDLRLIDWSDENYKYVVVGATTFTALEAVAHGLNEG